MFSYPGDWKMCGEDHIQFLKLLVEDRNFLFMVYDRIKQEWFDLVEMRDIVRTIMDLLDSGEEITYSKIKETMAPRYDDESKEISWLIITEVLERMENSENLGWNKMFLDDINNEPISIPDNWS